MEEQSGKRLNKYISESGICSRREADRFIEQGVVFLNGKRAGMGMQVHPGDVVKVNGQLIEAVKEDEAIYIAFNKPSGITCTTDTSVKDNIVDYISYGERIFPIGRLDKESQGLIFLTSNGDIVNKILRAGNNHEKEYLVTTDKPITEAFINGMRKGVPILGVVTKKCVVERVSNYVFRIVLVQGMNRQIRRMCAFFDFDVVKLERTRIMHISLKGIPPGEYRPFTTGELEELQRLIRDSAKEADTAGSTAKKPIKTKGGNSPSGRSNTAAPGGKTFGNPDRRSKPGSGAGRSSSGGGKRTAATSTPGANARKNARTGKPKTGGRRK